MTRTPNLGHTALFALLLLCTFIPSAALILAFHLPQFLLLALTYCLTLALAGLIFPLLWQRPLLAGIHWNATAISPRLLLAGPAIAVLTQLIESRLATPKDLPIDEVFRNAPSLPILAIFAILLAPLFEEVVFRGFLLPALALALDYLRLPRSLEALVQWRTESTFSAVAMVLSSCITSALFALLHASQLGFYWPAVAVIFCVSLILCVVRFRTQSLAATVLIHVTYNATVFLALAVTKQS